MYPWDYDDWGDVPVYVALEDYRKGRTPMAYRYVNTEVPPELHFTDIEGPDGLVSHEQVLDALNRQLDETPPNEHVAAIRQMLERIEFAALGGKRILARADALARQAKGQPCED